MGSVVKHNFTVTIPLACFLAQCILLPALCNGLAMPEQVRRTRDAGKSLVSQTRSNFTHSLEHPSPTVSPRVHVAGKFLSLELQNVKSPVKRSLYHSHRAGPYLATRNSMGPRYSDKITLPLEKNWLGKLRERVERTAVRNLGDSRFLCCVSPGRKSKGSVECHSVEMLTKLSNFKCSSGLVYNIRFGSKEHDTP